MTSIENFNFTGRHLCFKLDHARSSIRLTQDHDFDINYKTRNRNPDSETRFGFWIEKCAPGLLRDMKMKLDIRCYVSQIKIACLLQLFLYFFLWWYTNILQLLLWDHIRVYMFIQPELLSYWSMYFNVLQMIGQSKMNEKFPDINKATTFRKMIQQSST